MLIVKKMTTQCLLLLTYGSQEIWLFDFSHLHNVYAVFGEYGER